MDIIAFSKEVNRAASLLGSQIPDALNLRVLHEYSEKHLSDLQDGEIMNAFEYFTSGKLEYTTDFTGLISGLLLTNVIKSYRDYWDKYNRAQRDKDYYKPLVAIGETDLEKKNREALLWAFEEFKKDPTQTVHSWVYDACDKRGLVNFTKEEKYDMLAEAEQQEKAELSKQKQNSQSYIEKKSLSALLERLTPQDCKGRAKSIAITQYFRDLIMEGTELADVLKDAK